VEWGIGGLKGKSKQVMKRFDSTKSEYTYLFHVITLFTNFLPKKHMDFTYEVVGDQNPNPSTHGWYKDF
jgi:hypothetical protein